MDCETNNKSCNPIAVIYRGYLSTMRNSTFFNCSVKRILSFFIDVLGPFHSYGKHEIFETLNLYTSSDGKTASKNRKNTFDFSAFN